MRCHSSSGQLSGLLVSENEWRRHDSEMEPQGRRTVSPLYTRRPNRTLRLRKTTLESRVHVQTIRLNAEKIISAPSRRRGFSLDIPFYRTSPVRAFTKHEADLFQLGSDHIPNRLKCGLVVKRAHGPAAFAKQNHADSHSGRSPLERSASSSRRDLGFDDVTDQSLGPFDEGQMVAEATLK